MKKHLKAFTPLKISSIQRSKTKFLTGFTLVETLITIMIIGILSGVVVPRVIHTTKTARYRSCNANVAQIDKQVELWHAHKGTWPAGDLQDIKNDPDYFPDGIPVCPVSGFNYWIYEDTYRVGGHDEETDAAHKELGYAKTGDYTYDSQGRLTGYVRRYYDGSGSLIRVYRYSDYVYDPITGKITSYKRTDYTATGEISRWYEYSNFTYGADGRLSYYERADYNERGALLRDISFEYTYYANGRRKTYIQNQKEKLLQD